MIDGAKRKHRIWLFRSIAILLGLMPIMGLESLLMLVDFPPANASIDPFVDLHPVRSLFELQEENKRYQIRKERERFFRPAEFEQTKAPKGFRVFCVGGSTTQGEPYSTQTAFGEWMRIYLQASAPDRSVEVINCGGLSYASYRIAKIVDEVLNYQPDLLVIDVGQNEFLEYRTYEEWHTRQNHSKLSQWFEGRKTVQLGRMWWNGRSSPRDAPKSRDVMTDEVDALLDYRGGLEAYRREAIWREPIVEHFRWNVEHIIDSCRSRNVPLILLVPVVNLLDCPPFKFESSPSASSEQLEQFLRFWEQAKSSDRFEEAETKARKALEIDPEHAGVHFLLGKILWAQSRWEEAAHHLLLAKEYDVCPLRALRDMQQLIRDLAEKHRLSSLDLDRAFSQMSPHGVVGARWLVDHVHPTVEGHQWIGKSLAELILNARWIEHSERLTDEEMTKLNRDHLSQLGEDYFQRGKQRLEGLMLWTQGRANKAGQPNLYPHPLENVPLER